MAQYGLVVDQHNLKEDQRQADQRNEDKVSEQVSARVEQAEAFPDFTLA